MECKGFTKNGYSCLATDSKTVPCALEGQLCDSTSNLRLDFTTSVPGHRYRQKMLVNLGTTKDINSSNQVLRFHVPIMNNMDEITYWIYTKRAPCLMNYDNVLKKRNEELLSSKHKPKSVPSVTEMPSPKMRKKRKLTLLDEASSEKQPNLYFDTSQNQKKIVTHDCESDTIGSDINFNIKKSSVQEKPKRKLQKNDKSILHKKNMILTSTPKVSTLRRSLRQAKQSSFNVSQLNNSFEIFDTSKANGNGLNCSAIELKSVNTLVKPSEMLAGGDQTGVANNNTKNQECKGQFEDMSDVSGFTANYIRSTRLQSTKTPRKLRCKNNRNLVKESRTSQPKDDTTVVCVNKSMNTGLQNKSVLNYSTDSSQNIINLVTSKNNDPSMKVCKSTSILKLVESKTNKSGQSAKKNKLEFNKTRSKSNLNISFQSETCSTPRYLTRYKNSIIDKSATISTNEVNHISDKIKTINKNPSEFNNSDRKENPDATTVSKTRSGRTIGLTMRQPENSVLVLSNSTEQVSSAASMNVATPVIGQKQKLRKKRCAARRIHASKLNEKSGNRSGFTACFSDSDDDSEPLKQRKFFRA